MRRNYIVSNIEIVLLILAIVGVVIGGIVLGNQEKISCQQSGGQYVSGMVGSKYVTMCSQ